MSGSRVVEVVDSHTEGEPTRVIVAGGPELGRGALRERVERFRTGFDAVRLGVAGEPRGSDVLVGALLVEPEDAAAVTEVIFFNDVGYLGMCGHGTIGVVRTLQHLGRVSLGAHLIETPVGMVRATLEEDGLVTVENVASYRYRAGVAVEVAGFGRMTGDVAWGGNWFFLVGDHGLKLEAGNRAALLAAGMAVREALAAGGITGEGGAMVDHVEFYGTAEDARNSARNFVLCPGVAFDRSPCGTGTSAKMACVYADGKLKEEEVWRQEGILGTVFEGSVRALGDGRVQPRIRGRAWITGESRLMFAEDDPFVGGIRFQGGEVGRCPMPTLTTAS